MSERQPHIFLEMPIHPDDPQPPGLVVKWLTEEEIEQVMQESR